MRFRWVIALSVVALAGLFGREALAASYQKTDGTIVDPMTSATCGPWGFYGSSDAIHPFVGSALGPGVRIPGSDLALADLRQADLRESDLRSVRFFNGLSSCLSHAALAAADLRAADVRFTNFEMANLARTDLRGPNGMNPRIENADLHGARLRISCSLMIMSGANLSGASLRESGFYESCFLSNTNLENADLRGSHFSQPDIGGGVNMNGADLRRVMFSSISGEILRRIVGTPYYDGTTTFYWNASLDTFDPVAAGWINLDLVDVDADGTPDSTDNCRFTANADQADGDSDEIGDACDFSPSKACLEMGALAKTTASLVAFQDNTCEDWSWTEQPAAFLQSAVLTETYLRSANFSGAVMANVNLAGADLTAAQLVNAYLANANLRSAILAYAHLAFADLTGANLANADLEAADLADAQLGSAQYDEATVFPSGRTLSAPPWGLPNDETPWDAGMAPVPEPSFVPALLLGTLALAMLKRGMRCFRGLAMFSLCLLADSTTHAASYQKTDGTIVDPITSAFCQRQLSPNRCTYPSPYSSEFHPFVGPPLGPEVRISGSDLSQADLRDADLREADLRAVNFQASDISRGDLRGADLRNTLNLIWTNLENVAISHADLRSTEPSWVHLVGTDLRSSRLRLNCTGMAEPIVVNIIGADMSRANLRDSRFDAECNLIGVNFENADLRGSSFSECGVDVVYMNGADLRGASFRAFGQQPSVILGTPYYDSTTFFSANSVDPVAAGWINLDLVDVDSDGTADSTDNCRFTSNADQADGDADEIGDACDFSPSTACLEMGSLPKSTASLIAFQDNTCQDWSWVQQPAAYLQSAILTESYLRSANLSGAVMANVDLAGADLTAAHLVNTNLENANLEAAVLAYAHLAFSNMIGANLGHADLESADLGNAQLTSAQYDEATVFPSGRNVSEPPWDLPNDVTPWGAGMIPVPEPGLAGLVAGGALAVAGLARRRDANA